MVTAPCPALVKVLAGDNPVRFRPLATVRAAGAVDLQDSVLEGGVAYRPLARHRLVEFELLEGVVPCP